MGHNWLAIGAVAILLLIFGVKYLSSSNTPRERRTNHNNTQQLRSDQQPISQGTIHKNYSSTSNTNVNVLENQRNESVQVSDSKSNDQIESSSLDNKLLDSQELSQHGNKSPPEDEHTGTDQFLGKGKLQLLKREENVDEFDELEIEENIDQSDELEIPQNVRPPLINGNDFNETCIILNKKASIIKVKKPKNPLLKKRKNCIEEQLEVYNTILENYIESTKIQDGGNSYTDYLFSESYRKLVNKLRRHVSNIPTRVLLPFSERIEFSSHIFHTEKKSCLRVLGFSDHIRGIKMTVSFLHANIPKLSFEQIDDPFIPENVIIQLKSFEKQSKFIDYNPEMSVIYKTVENLFKHLDGKCTNILPNREAFKSIYTIEEFKTSPGLPFSKGINTKGICLDWILKSLDKLTKQIPISGTFDFPPVCFGAQLDNESGNVKGEWIYPAAVNILERRFTISIYDEITNPKNWDFLPFKLPYMNYYPKLITDGRYCCEFEILNINGVTSTYIINYCFRIIHKWCFQKRDTNVSNEVLFKTLHDHFMFTIIKLPGSGQLIKKNHGIPYGSEFSLIITSITSTIIGIYCMISQGVEVYLGENEPKSIFVLGNSISISVPSTFSIVKLIKDVEKLGYQIDATNIRFNGGFEREFKNDIDEFEIPNVQDLKDVQIDEEIEDEQDIAPHGSTEGDAIDTDINDSPTIKEDLIIDELVNTQDIKPTQDDFIIHEIEIGDVQDNSSPPTIIEPISSNE